MNVSGIRFEWDEAKNVSNQRKHGISFEAASLVFFDPLHIVIDDRVVDCEQPWQALGTAKQNAESIFLLLVVHTLREEVEADRYLEVIRIISARRATPGGEESL